MSQEKKCFKTSIGGQALIEGILMRGPKMQAIVCRTEDGLVEKTEELRLLRERYPFFGLPLVRGCVTFFDSLVKGMQALTYSASLVPLEQQGEPDKIDEWISRHFPEEKAEKLIIYTAVILGIALSSETAHPQLSGTQSVGRAPQGRDSACVYGAGCTHE